MREGEITVREDDVKVREQELEKISLDHCAERARLEGLDRAVAAAQASYNERMEKANAQLAKKRKKVEEDLAKELDAGRAQYLEEYRRKLATQESRFKKKIEELEGTLRKTKITLKAESEAKDCAAKEGGRFQKELLALQEQVGPVTEALHRSQEAEKHALVLQRERGKMFRELAARGRGATTRLGVEGLSSPDGDDAAAYLTFFAELVVKLEAAATGVDNIVDEECRDLLSVAATRVFSNLYHANPGFDFSPVLKPVEREFAAALVKEVTGPVEALLQLYVRGDEAEKGGDEDQDGEELQD